ncbi:MAG: hypothetical protein AABZ12_09170 [Planctomycetota bacterium]
MTDYTPYQRKAINRYYDHKDDILLGRLGEIVTDLYLAEDQGKCRRLWSRAEKAMAGLRIPEPLAKHILESQKVEMLARNLQQWQEAAKRSPQSQPRS